MKFSKKLLTGSVAAAVMAVGAYAPVASADVSASAGVASSYLWRGIDLGQGTPAVSGDIQYTTGGFYTGVWVSSGDTSGGTEYDLFAGFGGELGSVTYDVSIWNYLYPTGTNEDGTSSQEDTIADLTELITTVGVGPVSFSWYENIANNGGDETYRYFTLGYSAGKFGATLGKHTGNTDVLDGPTTTESMHLDLSYAYNDNLSFTVSQNIDDDDDAVDDDINVVVSYSLPIK
ncbi:MAG: hypothetical protein ACI90R_002417 [Alteromonas macleodii]|jgi:uncharacterized protein (TIGR02001 family)